MAEQDFDIKVRTKADTSGAKEAEKSLSDIDKTAGRISGKLVNFRAALSQFVGLFSGFAVIGQIKELTAEIQKITAELAAQGKQLTRNAQQYQEMATGAKTEADTIKVVDAALKDVQKAQDDLNAAREKELTPYQKAADFLSHQLNVRHQTAGMTEEELAENEKVGRVNQQALDAEIEGKERALSIAQQTARFVQRAAGINIAELDKDKAKPFADAVSEVNDQIAKLRSQQAALVDELGFVTNSKAYFDLAKQIELAKRNLFDLMNLEEARQKKLSQATPRVQAIARNEEAARKARAEGREKDAEMFAKTAEQLGGVPQKPETAEEMHARQIKSVEGMRKAQEESAQRMREAAGKMPWEIKRPDQLQEALKGGGTQAIIDALHELRDQWR